MDNSQCQMSRQGGWEDVDMQTEKVMHLIVSIARYKIICKNTKWMGKQLSVFNMLPNALWSMAWWEPEQK